MSAPAVIFGAAALISLGCLALRRRPLAPHLLACAGCALIGLLVLTVPLEQALSFLGLSLRIDGSMQLLGRQVIVDQRSRAAISFLFLSGSLFFSVSWVSRPGRSFTPVGVLILALLAGSLTIEPFLFAALFLELAAMAAILILIPPGSPGPARVLQLLILYTLAMAGILFTGWLFENVGVTSVTPELADRVMVLLAFGFSILMFVPPFHFWLPSAADQVKPPALAFVAVALQSAGLFFLLRFLDTYAWLRADARVTSAISVAGIVMIASGSLSAMAQTSLRKVAAYALIADFGVGLVAIGSNASAGFSIALSLAGARVVGLVLYSLASSRLTFDESQLRGAPSLARVGSLIGLASLAGIPLSAGFPARWTTIARLGLGATGLWVAAGTALVMVAVVRWGIRTAQLRERDPEQRGQIDPERGAGDPEFDRSEHRGREQGAGGLKFGRSEHPGQERGAADGLGVAGPEAGGSLSLPERAALSAAIALCLALGLAPQLTHPWVEAAMRGLTNLAP